MYISPGLGTHILYTLRHLSLVSMVAHTVAEYSSVAERRIPCLIYLLHAYYHCSRSHHNISSRLRDVGL